MSTIPYTNTQGLPRVKLVSTGEIMTVVNTMTIAGHEMLELARAGQLYTECHWRSETEDADQEG